MALEKKGKPNEIQNFRRIHPGTHGSKNPSPMLWTNCDLTFQDYLGWPLDDSGEKLDGEFLPETPGEAARERIEGVLAILDDWDDWVTEMGGDEDEDGCEELARIRRMKCHLHRTLKGLEMVR